MLLDFLKHLQDHLGAAKKFTLDDASDVFDRETYRPPLPRIPAVEGRIVHTLDAFADYILENPDALDHELGKFWVHVASPSRVCFISPPDANRCREIPLVAECPVQDVSILAHFHGPDDFVPALLAMEDKGDRAKILKMMRTVDRERSEVVEDDMGGQTVKTESRGGLKGWTPQDNPLSLAPWRTFPEVDQPLGLFVVRWNADGEFKLVASPDERWRLEAVRSVAGYLKERFGDTGPPVFA